MNHFIPHQRKCRRAGGLNRSTFSTRTGAGCRFCGCLIRIRDPVSIAFRIINFFFTGKILYIRLITELHGLCHKSIVDGLSRFIITARRKLQFLTGMLLGKLICIFGIPGLLILLSFFSAQSTGNNGIYIWMCSRLELIAMCQNRLSLNKLINRSTVRDKTSGRFTVLFIGNRTDRMILRSIIGGIGALYVRTFLFMLF